MKAADVVGALFVSEQSVRNWRSAGVPPRRRPQLADWMAEVDAARQETAVDLLRIRPLVVEADPAEFHAWENAALQEGKTLTEWARRGLTKMASRRGFGGGLPVLSILHAPIRMPTPTRAPKTRATPDRRGNSIGATRLLHGDGFGFIRSGWIQGAPSGRTRRISGYPAASVSRSRTFHDSEVR